MGDPTIRPEYRLINVLFEMRVGLDALHRARAALTRAGHGERAEDLDAAMTGVEVIRGTVRELAEAERQDTGQDTGEVAE